MRYQRRLRCSRVRRVFRVCATVSTGRRAASRRRTSTIACSEETTRIDGIGAACSPHRRVPRGGGQRLGQPRGGRTCRQPERVGHGQPGSVGAQPARRGPARRLVRHQEHRDAGHSHRRVQPRRNCAATREASENFTAATTAAAPRATAPATSTVPSAKAEVPVKENGRLIVKQSGQTLRLDCASRAGHRERQHQHHHADSARAARCP